MRRILGAYAAYNNELRTHTDAPFQRAIESLDAITSYHVLGGLHHQYCRCNFRYTQAMRTSVNFLRIGSGAVAESRMHILLRKLISHHEISLEEREAVLAVLGPTIMFGRGTDIVPDGSIPKHTTVMLSGTACRYKILPGGTRHILSFQYPGDMTDLFGYVMKKLDHAVGALSDCTIAQITHEHVAALCEKYPNLQYSFWRDTLLDTLLL